MIRSRENPVLRDFRRVREENDTRPKIWISAFAWLNTFREYDVFGVYSKDDLAAAKKVLKKLEGVYR